MKWRCDHRSCNCNLSNCELSPKKQRFSGFNGIRTRGLCIRAAVLFQLGYKDLAPVVQKLDSAIHRINLYAVDNAIGFPNTYPLDSDLSGG